MNISLRFAPLSWRPGPLILVLLLGLTACDIFDDAVDERAPAVQIQRPGTGATVSGANVLLVIKAQPQGTLATSIASVSVNLNGERLGEATFADSVFVYRWDTSSLSDGTYRLEATAFDALEARGISAPLTVRVVNPGASPGPEMAIIAPEQDATLAGTIRIIARPEPNQLPVTRVDFLVDGVVRATLTAPTSGDTYTYDWETTGELPGQHVLEVNAYSGDTTLQRSAPRTITLVASTSTNDDEAPFVWQSDAFQGVVRGSVAVGFNNDVYVASDDGSLYAYSPSGTLRWVFGDTQGPVRAAPLVGNNEDVFMVSESGLLYGLTGSGAPMWPPYATGSSIRSMPALGIEGALYFGDTAGRLHAVNSFNGLTLPQWPIQVDTTEAVSIVVPPVIAADRTVLVAGNNGHLYAFGPQGERLWKSAQNIGSIQAGLALIERTFSIPLPDGSIRETTANVVYAVSNNGNLYALSGLDGSVLWTEFLGDVPTGPRRSGPIVDPDGTIFVGTTTGLVALNEETDAFTPRLRFIFPAEDVGTPAIDANGNIYFVGGETLYAISPRNTPLWSSDLRAQADGPLTINREGLLLLATDSGFVHAFATGSAGLAPGKWPMFQRNARHSGRLGIDASDG